MSIHIGQSPAASRLAFERSIDQVLELLDRDVAPLPVDDYGFVLGSYCLIDGAGQVEQCLTGPFGGDVLVERLKRFVVLSHAATIPAMHVMPGQEG